LKEMLESGKKLEKISAGYPHRMDDLSHIEYELALEEMSNDLKKAVTPAQVRQARKENGIPASWKWQPYDKGRYSAHELGMLKNAASAPTRGNFMMASDQNAGPITPLFKGGDILPEEVTYSSGDFKPAKLMKKADISPTQPLGNGGGNPHRAASDQGRMPINPIFNPLQKRAEDGGGAEFGGQYYGGGGAMNPVYNMGFKQTSLQGRGRINPIKKEAFATPAGALASSRRLGTAPGALGAKGPSIHQISGVAGGPSLPGAIKPSSGFGEYRGKMQR